jgi:hypothetical protein
MRRRRFIAGCSLAAIVTLGNTSSTNAVTPGDLIGTWKLKLYEDRPAGGKPEYPYGEKAFGLLIYDSTGHMSVQISQPPVPKGRSGRHKAGPDEGRAAAYTAYFGTYTVDLAKQIITHTVEGNLYPAYVGTSHERPFELTGDRLLLKPQWEREGKRVQGVRVFERIR